VFDPFGDFDTEGYLRNFDKEKDLEIVKIAEHELFRAQLPVALNFLAKKKKRFVFQPPQRVQACSLRGAVFRS
jgi:SpoVK/Ycf46/Vps4 family AAA+-type ATPase